MNVIPVPLSDHAPDSVRAVIALYLLHAGRDASARAWADRKLVLERFDAVHGHLPLSACKPYHLRLWVDGNASWRSEWTRQRVISTVQRCFNWSVKLGVIDKNPFWGVTGRQGQPGRPMTAAEFAGLLRGTDALFRRVLVFLRYTGCRPGEMAAAGWADLGLERGVIQLGRHKTARATGRPRVIVLHPVVVGLLCYLRKRLLPGQETIFVNSKGRPWTRYALACRLTRLRKAGGLPADCRLYGLRHKFGTDAVLHGCELKTLSVLMGHSTTRTTEHYTHIAGKTDYLRKALGGIFGGEGSG